MKAQPQALYAFWKYDHYPYHLGGELIQVLDSGRVRVKGYDGMTFTPIKIVPFEIGQKIKAELDKLRAAHATAHSEFENEWRSRAHDVLTIGE